MTNRDYLFETPAAMGKTKKKNGLAIFLIALTLLIGGTLIGVLVYLNLEGHLEPLMEELRTFLSRSKFLSVMAIVWMIAIPVLLIALLVLNSVRRKRFQEMSSIWRRATALLAKQEAEERAAAQEKAEVLPDPRFSALRRLDSGGGREYRTTAGANVKTLRELCDRFRNFAAAKLGLYYSIDDIRAFIAGMAVSRVLILQGMSGTGKTSLAYAFGEFLDNPSVIVPVQPMWKERTDLLGYYNEFTKQYNETLLLQKMYEADRSDLFYIVVLDELNIARVEYYFAEFLSLLEIPDTGSRYLDVVPDIWPNDPKGLKAGRIHLPDNMWFIGTANNDDSTFAISDKVYDRAMIMDLNNKADPFMVDEDAPVGRVAFTAEHFRAMVAEEEEWFEITARNKSRLKELDEYLIEKFRITFGNRIMRQIRSYISVYVACGGEELDALDDILSKKVMRKLAALNAAYVRSEAEALSQFLDDLFGDDRMVRCKDAIRRIVQNG